MTIHIFGVGQKNKDERKQLDGKLHHHEFRKERVTTQTAYEPVWELLEASFCPTEYSPKYYYIHKILYDERFKCYSYKNKQGKCVALIQYWNLPSLIYVEHIAVSKECRGKNMGTRIMKELLANVNKQVVLEVEDPNHLPKEEQENGWRRIKFYERLGFFTNAYAYKQPVINTVDKEPPMLLFMTSKKQLNEEEFKHVYNIIMEYIYGDEI